MQSFFRTPKPKTPSRLPTPASAVNTAKKARAATQSAAEQFKQARQVITDATAVLAQAQSFFEVAEQAVKSVGLLKKSNNFCKSMKKTLEKARDGVRSAKQSVDEAKILYQITKAAVDSAKIAEAEPAAVELLTNDVVGFSNIISDSEAETMLSIFYQAYFIFSQLPKKRSAEIDETIAAFRTFLESQKDSDENNRVLQNIPLVFQGKNIWEAILKTSNVCVSGLEDHPVEKTEQNYLNYLLAAMDAHYHQACKIAGLSDFLMMERIRHAYINFISNLRKYIGLDDGVSNEKITLEEEKVLKAGDELIAQKKEEDFTGADRLLMAAADEIKAKVSDIEEAKKKNKEEQELIAKAKEIKLSQDTGRTLSDDDEKTMAAYKFLVDQKQEKKNMYASHLSDLFSHDMASIYYLPSHTHITGYSQPIADNVLLLEKICKSWIDFYKIRDFVSRYGNVVVQSGSYAHRLWQAPSHSSQDRDQWMETLANEYSVKIDQASHALKLEIVPPLPAAPSPEGQFSSPEGSARNQSTYRAPSRLSFGAAQTPARALSGSPRIVGSESRNNSSFSINADHSSPDKQKMAARQAQTPARALSESPRIIRSGSRNHSSCSNADDSYFGKKGAGVGQAQTPASSPLKRSPWKQY